MNRLQNRLAALVFLAAFIVAGALLPLAMLGQKFGLGLDPAELAKSWWRGVKLTMRVLASGRRRP